VRPGRRRCQTIATLCKLAAGPGNGYFYATMRTGLSIMLALALAAVLGALIVGVVGMLRGGEFHRKYGNKLMQLRVVLQGVALVMIVLFALLASA